MAPARSVGDTREQAIACGMMPWTVPPAIMRTRRKRPMYAIPIPGVRFTPPLPPRQAIAELSAWEERKTEGAVVVLERQGRSYRVVEIQQSAFPFFAGIWLRDHLFRDPSVFVKAIRRRILERHGCKE